MRIWPRWVVAAIAASAIGFVACGASPEEERADLCGDLANLTATFGLVIAPPSEATLGEVRGALEKVAPFLERLAASETTSPELDERLVAVEAAFHDGLADLGDDEPAAAADLGLRAVRPRLAAAVAEASSALGCRL